MSTPFLSLVIPARNEEARLPSSLEQALEFVQGQSYATEVLIVDNGSCDRTLEIARAFAARHAQFRVLEEPLRGKGQAVKRGMLAAEGEYRFMCDADFSMPITEVNRFLPPALVGSEVVIASREAPGAVRYNEPPYRHLVGRVFNTLIRLIALPGLDDTQCGFKCFHGAAAEDLFRRQILSGWSFDVEVLYIARRRGYRIVELPIPWYFNSNSKISVVRDSLRMLLDLFTIRLNGLRGVYDSQV